MPLERAEEARAWATKAALDLQAAEHLLTGAQQPFEPAVFHCQQAAERALKEYLVSRDLTFSKTHDLVGHLTLCAKMEEAFVALQDAAIVLTPYAVTFRYPSEMPAPSSKQSEEALSLARSVVSFVLDLFPRTHDPDALTAMPLPFSTLR